MRFLYARLLTRPVIADGELSPACPAAICWGGGAAGPFSCVPSVLLTWVLARRPGPSGPALVRYTFTPIRDCEQIGS